MPRESPPVSRGSNALGHYALSRFVRFTQGPSVICILGRARASHEKMPVCLSAVGVKSGVPGAAPSTVSPGKIAKIRKSESIPESTGNF